MKYSAQFMFGFGLLTFIVISLVVYCGEFAKEDFILWVFRVLIALASAAISISLPGMLQIRYSKEEDGMKALQAPSTLAETQPVITASGAIAVFVLVYLFDPLF